ncbi:hypothetical protein E4T44_10670 [Aureobasidium sp. EXF-8845]|nr:hypothetical protein E4T45_13421 [Aureobasidium sp. EXF-8846]KAI4814803.1 hypothetical protein E4T44_10670 [Aureobasidium sp. EXF-8845]
MNHAHWLDQYASNYHEWRQARIEGKHCFYRPLGTVETAFDSDGIYYEGRADVNALLELQTKHRLSQEQLRHRITLAWTVLRLSHVLLLARAVNRKASMTAGNASQTRFFLVCPPDDFRDAITDATKALSFIEQPVDDRGLATFYRHAQNTGRVRFSKTLLRACRLKHRFRLDFHYRKKIYTPVYLARRRRSAGSGF